MTEKMINPYNGYGTLMTDIRADGAVVAFFFPFVCPRGAGVAFSFPFFPRQQTFLGGGQSSLPLTSYEGQLSQVSSVVKGVHSPFRNLASNACMESFDTTDKFEAYM